MSIFNNKLKKQVEELNYTVNSLRRHIQQLRLSTNDVIIRNDKDEIPSNSYDCKIVVDRYPLYSKSICDVIVYKDVYDDTYVWYMVRFYKDGIVAYRKVYGDNSNMIEGSFYMSPKELNEHEMQTISNYIHSKHNIWKKYIPEECKQMLINDKYSPIIL